MAFFLKKLPKMIGVACHGYLKNRQSDIEKLKKKLENGPFNRKKWNPSVVLWYKVLSTQNHKPR